MARPRKLVDVNKKNFTKDEIDERKKEEEKLKDFEKLNEKIIPSYLDSIAKAEWKRIIPLMELLPISELDRNLLAMYCSYYSIFIQATLDINNYGINIEEDRGGMIIRKQNPSITTLNSSSKEIKSIAATMGLTLDSRLRLLNPKNEDEIKDPFADFFKEEN
jgi:P27 family predicted phage terminase small subunit